MPINNSIQELWDLFVSDKASAEEVNALFEHIRSAENNEAHIAFFRQAIDKVPTSFYRTDDAVIRSVLDAIVSSDDDLKASLNTTVQAHPIGRTPVLRKWVWAAASIILLVGIGAYLWTNKKKNPAAVAVVASDIQPGKNGAILTLDNGSRVVLDSLGNGMIATQGGSRVLLKNGQLAYDPTGQSAVAVAYNTMSTPKGRQFSLQLPDGTKVWLNAASSLRYPTVFAGKERRVEVTGEAYFEVAPLTSRQVGTGSKGGSHKVPFIVKIGSYSGNGAEVKVLGTHFNVNAYENEASINTTLLEGSVVVTLSSDRQQQTSLHDQSVILKPGQQAQIAGAVTKGDVANQEARQGIKVINDADIDKTMAWKNGLFNFDGASLYEVMKQIERWYDIEVVYEKDVRNSEFVGKLTRDVTLNQLLDGFKEFGIHYKFEGRKLIILP